MHELRTLTYDGELTLPLVTRAFTGQAHPVYGLGAAFVEREATHTFDSSGNKLVPVQATYYPLRHQTRVTFEVHVDEVAA